MIQKHHRRAADRRILTFPAVHPCEGISPSTLLSSLVSLSDEIRRLRALSFPTQRRNVRDAVRTASLLHLFFEEAIGVGSSSAAGISDPAVVLCLSELHLALQRLRFLLEDLSRDGARVWVLAKCELVASQFRVFARSVSTALDVLPLRSAGLECEVVEIVELVGEQSRRAKFGLNREDRRFSDQVFAILSKVERKIEPSRSSIKRVLDYLGIKTWSDCNEEVMFLEEEIEFEASDCGEREVPLLSALLGLMSYSRAVVFEEYEWRRSREVVVDSPRLSGATTEALRCLNPADFRCPISLEIMIDPVTVSTGQTYDRGSIQKWLRSGNTTCPKTGEKLATTELVPNSALRRLIRDFLEENGVSISKPGRKPRDVITAGSPAAAGAARLLSAFLVRRLVFGSSAAKNKAAYEIRLVAKSSGLVRSSLVDAGAVLPLLNLLSTAADAAAEENAAAALLKLSKDGSGRVLIVESGGLGPIVSVLDRGKSPESRQIAAAATFYLASSPEHRQIIGESARAIPALAELLRTGTACGRKNAVVAIYALLSHPGNTTRVLRAGTVPLLINALTFPYKPEVANDTLAVLSALAENPDGASEIAAQASSVSKIKAVIQASTSRASKEYCVSILLSLCNNVGPKVTGVLAKDQSLMGLLYSVITDGTSISTKKARCLIQILHRFRETTGSSGDLGFSHEQSFVRAW